MAVQLAPLGRLLPIAGLQLGTAGAGIKHTNRDDVVLIHLTSEQASCAAVFTRNAFCAAPVVLAKQHLASTAARYCLINSGNANAGTGAAGLQAAQATCQAVAELHGGSAEAVLPFSTGVIGQALPVEKIRTALPNAIQALSEDNWTAAAKAIMTTDTQPKGFSRQVEVQGQTLTVTGISKGAGMIRPDMATMLAFIGTDAAVPSELLQRCLAQAMDVSFNRISVDGDTSTNDACVLMASGQGAVQISNEQDPAWTVLCETVTEVCQALAQAIVRDGEGATKFITIAVEGAANREECLAVAYTIAHSPLVKTAFFASDANWGRILAAVGRAGLNNLVLEDVQIDLNEVNIVRQGGVSPEYTEAQGQRVMQETDITIRVQLGRGEVSDQVWTCDLSHEYVSINADYRT